MSVERRQGMLLGWLLALVACSSTNKMSSSSATDTGGVGGGAGTMAPSTTAGASGSTTSGSSGAKATGGTSASGAMMTNAGRSGGTATAGASGAIAAGASGAAGTNAVAGSGAGAAGTAGAAGGMMSTAQTLPPITDYTQAGPFKTKVEANMGPGSNYTMYRPDPLGENGFLHSPIIFGPGIATSCAPGGLLNVYTDLLTHLASHGFVTICVNSLGGGPGDPANLDAMKMGLEWIIAQNTQPGVYQGKLAVDRAITMGYSIGAGASVNLSSHPAIMTTVVIHDHNTMGDPHGPVLMITGTMDVIDDMRATLKTLDEAPAVLVALPIGHLDVITEIAAGGRYVAPITAWLRYWVNGDQGAKHFFSGADCDMCKSPWITPEPNDKWKALQ